METERLVELVGRYVQAWNEPDPERRRSALVALYTPEGRLITQSHAFEGIEAIIAHIAEVHREFIASGRFRFQSRGAMADHASVLFSWGMIEAQDGALADAGMNLFVLAADGRIDGDHQFVLGVDSSIGHLAVAR